MVCPCASKMRERKEEIAMESAFVWIVLTMAGLAATLAIALALDWLLSKRRLARDFDFKYYKKIENR
jgi:hypothetical protein